MDGVWGGIFVIICIFSVLGFFAYLEHIRNTKEAENKKLIREINRSFNNNEHWRSLRMLDALSAGLTIEFIDVTKNKIILKTPDGLVNAMVNQDNLPHFLLELKMSSKRIYKYSDVFINLNMDNQKVIIDKISYA